MVHHGNTVTTQSGDQHQTRAWVRVTHPRARTRRYCSDCQNDSTNPSTVRASGFYDDAVARTYQVSASFQFEKVEKPIRTHIGFKALLVSPDSQEECWQNTPLVFHFTVQAGPPEKVAIVWTLTLNPALAKPLGNSSGSSVNRLLSCVSKTVSVSGDAGQVYLGWTTRKGAVCIRIGSWPIPYSSEDALETP